MRLTPREEVYKRIKKLQQLMIVKGLPGLFINHLVNLFYYSGTMQGFCLFIPSEGEPVLFVRKNLRRASNESPLEQIVEVSGIKDIKAALTKEGYEEPIAFGLELDFLPVKHYNSFKEIFPNSAISDISREARSIRMVKSTYEQKFIKEAGNLAKQVYEKIPQMIELGMTEISLAAKLEHEMRRLGHQGILRVRGYNQEIHYGYVLFGENALITSYFDSPTGGVGLSAAFPQGSSKTILESGRPILVDYAFVLDGYIVDLTRIYCVGKLDEKLTAAHQAAIAIQNKLAELALPGVKTDYLYSVALSMVQEYGLKDNFMGIGENQARFVGHGVGLELDELPVITDKVSYQLEEGMSITLEPKFFFPKLGIVGIENTFIVAANGLEKVCLLSDELVTINL